MRKRTIFVLIVIAYFILYGVCNAQKPSNANYYELSYKINTPKKFGETADIIGVVVKRHTAKNNGITEYYVTLVNHNTTYRVKVLEKAVFEIIQDGQRLVLPNCRIIKLKQ